MTKSKRRAPPSIGAVRPPARAREAEELTAVEMEICQRIMLGESVRRICMDEHTPAQSTVFEWLVSKPHFRAAYNMAKTLLAETLAEEVLEISDDDSGDFVKGEDGAQFDSQHVQRAKLRVDSRKWLAAKLSPKRYGDTASLRIGDLGDEHRKMSQEEIVTRLAAIAAAVEKRKG